MKAVIACGGLGRRLWPLTAVTNKHLLPVGREPIILRLVRQLVEVGVTEIAIGINGPFTKGFYELFKLGNQFSEYVTIFDDLVIGGPGRTVLSMSDWVGNDAFLCILGDTVFFDGFPLKLISAPKKYINVMCVMNVNQFDDPSKYGQVILENERIVYIVWKPEKLYSNIIQVPVYRFSSDVFGVIKKLDNTFGDEREIHMTDIVRILIDSQQMFGVNIPPESYIDAGTHDAFETINRKLLRDIPI